MSNYPDDWHSYYYTCTRCSSTYHASGVQECACEWFCDGCRVIDDVNGVTPLTIYNGQTLRLCARCLPEFQADNATEGDE